jgi:hypothetical protein
MAENEKPSLFSATRGRATNARNSLIEYDVNKTITRAARAERARVKTKAK